MESALHEIMGFFAHAQTMDTRPLFPPTRGLGTRLIYLYTLILGTINKLLVLFQVLGLWLLVNLKEYSLGLAVAEINIKFETA